MPLIDDSAYGDSPPDRGGGGRSGRYDVASPFGDSPPEDDSFGFPRGPIGNQYDDPLGDSRLDDFRSYLDEYNPRFFEAADILNQRAQGIDPLFGRLREDALSRERGTIQEYFARRGGAGTGSELDALLAAERQSTNQFDLMGLQRSDNALLQQFDVLTPGLENLTIEEQLRIAELNARNAGKSPTQPDDDGIFGLGIGPF